MPSHFQFSALVSGSSLPDVRDRKKERTGRKGKRERGREGEKKEGREGEWEKEGGMWPPRIEELA